MTGKGLPKRGKESEDFAKDGKRKGRNDPLDYVKSLKCFDAPDGLN